MDFTVYIRLLLIFFFFVSAQLMLMDGTNKKEKNNEYIVYKEYFDMNDLSNPNEIFVNPAKYDLHFPLTNGTTKSDDVENAIKYLKLPTWSKGYNKCDSLNAEVSCFEVVRAANTIQNWEKSVKSKKTIGQVYVNPSSNDNLKLGDMMSMLYHGLQIAIATNRKLVTDKDKYKPFNLPDIIKQVNGKFNGNSIPTDFHFGCADFSTRFSNIQFSEASWPQVLYTHHEIAPKMRESFGFHAAYFLGNFLFGTLEKPKESCFMNNADDIVEGWSFVYFYNDMIGNPEAAINSSDFHFFLGRCGVEPSTMSLITNDNISQIKANTYKEIITYDNSPEKLYCALRKMTSSKRIIHTFGSRLGFWATALQGSKGGFINTIDKICVNLTNSQQGSLWHTFCPAKLSNIVYRTNNWFYICGPNAQDAKMYIEYLLW